MQNVFIIGSKGIPAAYGGFETFVDKLTEYHSGNSNIKYHIACKSGENGDFEYNNAHCFKISVPDIGSAQAVYYDLKALDYCCNYIREKKIEDPIVYVLTCRIGPWARKYAEKIHRLGGKLYLNPDGHEWKRAKWSPYIRKYWKISEKLMVKNADLVICDSKNIEKYISDAYSEYKPAVTYIAYGAEILKSDISDDDEELLEWYSKNGLTKGQYYLIVGRFVPENNYETMFREFMKSSSEKQLAVITDASGKFYNELKEKTHFDHDKRIKLCGTVYDQDLLKKIRENAYGYIHGHEVGGTNPSLLEALGSTNLNLLLDVGFNRECAENGALYWTKDKDSLSSLIEKADKMSAVEIHNYSVNAKKRIEDSYNWEYIAGKYEQLFMKI